MRQIYTTNVDLLKTHPKAPKQQPEQENYNFFCESRNLARRASPHLIGQIVRTSFVEGLKSPTVSWDLKKAKSRTVEEALMLAIELDTFIALERKNDPGSATKLTSVLSKETI